jgi:hypothetical protein
MGSQSLHTTALLSYSTRIGEAVFSIAVKVLLDRYAAKRRSLVCGE